MKLIDAHHHLWKYNLRDYTWMDDSMEVLKQDFLPGNLKKEMKKAGVDGTVVVQARQQIEETEWLLSLADKYDFIKGVVGWLDLRSPELIEQLQRFSEHPKFVGVRHVIHDEPDVDFMLKSDFIKGVEKLQNFDLAYDLLLFPQHLANASKLVKMFPDQRFVLDHIAKPKIKKGILDPWQKDIFKLAEQTNTWCKISGMVTEANHSKWQLKHFVPYLETVCASFGPERIMLGSDWPVCRLAATYEQVFEIPLLYFDGWKEKQKNKIFRQNCIDFYKLS